MSVTPTQANRIAKWIQVVLIILQALGTIVKMVPKSLAKFSRLVKRR